MKIVRSASYFLHLKMFMASCIHQLPIFSWGNDHHVLRPSPDSELSNASAVNIACWIWICLGKLFTWDISIARHKPSPKNSSRALSTSVGNHVLILVHGHLPLERPVPDIWPRKTTVLVPQRFSIWMDISASMINSKCARREPRCPGRITWSVSFFRLTSVRSALSCLIQKYVPEDTNSRLLKSLLSCIGA